MTGSSGGWPPERAFRWHDGERLVRFGRGSAGEVTALLGELGFGEFALLTTPRAQHQAPGLAESAAVVVHVPPGQVPDAAAAIAADAGGLPPVALGGGRVVDTAKAIAAVAGVRCAAVPTTLAGADMNGHHRTLPGHEQGPHTRPALVVYDPALAASQPDAELAASAMNALAHAAEGLITPRANPVSEVAALRAAQLISSGLRAPVADRDALALGGMLGGYVLGMTGFAVHHVVCQTLVRTAGTPHGITNAIVLPHSIAFLTAACAAGDGPARGGARRRPGAPLRPTRDRPGFASWVSSGSGWRRSRRRPRYGPSWAELRAARLWKKTWRLCSTTPGDRCASI